MRAPDSRQRRPLARSGANVDTATKQLDNDQRATEVRRLRRALRRVAAERLAAGDADAAALAYAWSEVAA